jgi:hypothetical protein
MAIAAAVVAGVAVAATTAIQGAMAAKGAQQAQEQMMGAKDYLRSHINRVTKHGDEMGIIAQKYGGRADEAYKALSGSAPQVGVLTQALAGDIAASKGQYAAGGGAKSAAAGYASAMLAREAERYEYNRNAQLYGQNAQLQAGYDQMEANDRYQALRGAETSAEVDQGIASAKMAEQQAKGELYSSGAKGLAAAASTYSGGMGGMAGGGGGGGAAGYTMTGGGGLGGAGVGSGQIGAGGIGGGANYQLMGNQIPAQASMNNVDYENYLVRNGYLAR